MSPIISPSGGGGSQPVLLSDSDPGAIGARRLWLQTNINGFAEQLNVRNATDDGWLPVNRASDGYALYSRNAVGNGSYVSLSDASGDNAGGLNLHGGDTAVAGDGGAVALKGGDSFGLVGGPVQLIAGSAADGASGGSRLDLNPGHETSGPGSSALKAGDGGATFDGGDVSVGGGVGSGVEALLIVEGSNADGTHGKIVVRTNNKTFTWTQAAFVPNGSTVDQLRDALIAAGLMAAS